MKGLALHLQLHLPMNTKSSEPLLKIHYLQHVPFEGIACIEDWIALRNHSVSATRLYEDASFPAYDSFDWLIVMGGPMGVYDEEKYPWLQAEKEFIRGAISNDKTVIGICLGAQLLAVVLGARVYTNKYKEIGWFDIGNPPGFMNEKWEYNINGGIKAFHWHGDTFDLPQNSIHLFSSAACENQGFLYKSNVLGLQFHFEATPQSVMEMVSNGEEELTEGKYIQRRDDILRQKAFYSETNQMMFNILDHLSK